ncbi:MAG: HAD-IC family P-type ATPase [Lachnospiraceae bacterium]|nr:HAD-IC family P-type ATPase [Lachnospiraceae bacterium]
MKKTFKVTGMSCANCVSNVEKAVKKIDGINEVNVNLIEELMLVNFDEEKTDEERIAEAVRKAGYGAYALDAKEDKKEKAAPEKDHKKASLIASIIIIVILMVVAMGPKWDVSTNALLQLLLVIPVLILNRHFYINAFKALRSGGTNMDVLVSLGSLCALFYSLYGLFMILISFERGDSMKAMDHSMNLYFDSAGMILTLVSVGKYLESKSKTKTKDAIEGLIDMCPKKIIRIKTDENGNETEETVSLEEIKKDDVILISKGEAASVDGTVIFGKADFDESAITGESVAVRKEVGDEVTSGTMVKEGFVRVKAEGVGEESTLMKIVKMTKEAGATKAPIARLADKISAVFVPAIIAIAIITFIVWLILTKDFKTAFSNGICVLVISCPCALGLATPVAITVGMGIGAKKGILFKSAESLERLRSTDTIVFDKTGTVTKGVVSVEGEVSKDEVRETSPIAMKILKGMGFETIMLTGDKKDKALKIAEEAGVSSVRYELKPEDKAGIVQGLQKEGKKILMVGDGINDAPALASAEVGMAMGAGKDIAIECADVVLMHSDLLDVVRAIRLSKKTITNIKENLFWAFFYNVLMIPVAAGLMQPLIGLKLNPMIGAACMSLSSICVCLNALRLMSVNLEKNIENPYNERGCECNISTDKGEPEDMISFTVNGMMCEHCKKRVEDTLKAIDGVVSANADLEAKKVSVETSGEVDIDTLKAAVKGAGYEVE